MTQSINEAATFVQRDLDRAREFIGIIARMRMSQEYENQIADDDAVMFNVDDYVTTLDRLIEESRELLAAKWRVE